MRRLFLATLAVSLPSLCAAGPNAGAQIDLAPLGPPCGLAAGQSMGAAVTARAMDQVRQIKFEMSWEPAAAVDSVFAALGAETAAEAFINPGPPFVENGRAEWGIAVFGGEDLAGRGHLADLSFKLAPGVGPDTEIAIYLDAISLGPSSAERDTVRPAQAMLLGNFCDAEGQALPPELRLLPPAGDLAFSPAGSGPLADASAGEAPLSARIFADGRFRVGESISFSIDNRGPGTVFALADAGAEAIAPGATHTASATSDHRGQARLLLDAESGPAGAQTTALFTVCSADDLCAEGTISWLSPMTAVLTPQDAALPRDWALEQNYPNPFNAGTTIAFSAPAGPPLLARLDIFNLSGQQVATPFAGMAPPGRHQLHWDGRGPAGAPAASGIYIYRLRVGAAQWHRSMVLLR